MHASLSIYINGTYPTGKKPHIEKCQYFRAQNCIDTFELQVSVTNDFFFN